MESHQDKSGLVECHVTDLHQTGPRPSGPRASDESDEPADDVRIVNDMAVCHAGRRLLYLRTQVNSAAKRESVKNMKD